MSSICSKNNWRMKTLWPLLIALAVTVMLLAFGGCSEPTESSNADVSSDAVPQTGTSADKSNIPFTVSVYRNIRVSDNKSDFDARILRTFSELTAFYDADNHESNINYIEKYHNSFFDENAVILLCIKRTSGSIRDRIDKVSRENGKLAIQYTTLHPTPQTGDMAYWRILIEVKKTDVGNIADIVPRQREETLPSGKAFKQDSLEYIS